MATRASGVTRNPTRVSVGTNDTELSFTPMGALMVANYEPPKMLRAIHGDRFAAVVGNGATFKAPVTAIPTTTATWMLFNNESATSGTGKTYFVDKVSAFLASGTAASGITLLGCVTLASQTAPSAYASTVVSALDGTNGTSTNGILANAHTITGTQPAWHVLAGIDNVAAATIGMSVTADLDGGYLIPPQYGMGITVLSGVGTTALYGVSVIWDEINV